MKYDPNNPLSEEELDKLGKDDFDGFLEYLDGKSEHMKKFIKPLDTYHLKRFASQAKMQTTGESLTTEEIKKLQKLGKENEMIGFDKEKHEEWIEKKHDMLKSVGVKNIKTNRSQWFD